MLDLLTVISRAYTQFISEAMVKKKIMTLNYFYKPTTQLSQVGLNVRY